MTLVDAETNKLIEELAYLRFYIFYSCFDGANSASLGLSILLAYAWTIVIATIVVSVLVLYIS